MVPPPNELCGIPGFGLVPDQEIRHYIQNLGPAALKSSPTEAIKHRTFFGTLPLRQFKIFFIGDTLVVCTTKDISKGEEIYNCYGPHYCRMNRDERQAVLQSQYHFTCDCAACQGGDVDHHRFGAYKCPRCAGVVHTSTCLECDLIVDSSTMANLKARSTQCQKLFENACGLMNAQQYQAALAVFEQCREQRQEFLYKHHRDLALVQDALARCWASQGDFCTAADHLNASVEFARLLYGSRSLEYAHELHKLAEVLFNAGRVRECVDVADRCLHMFADLYPPGHKVLREVKELCEMAQKALVPQVNPR
ncbi:SET and MYND domain-containing protein 4-like [Plakobranchus ocellatus]|uniref:SET and MYND domain-containing protein 4-like n=1 Tax=Plakobranchus ocellatus TaxID=259542 RepID=A0AAV4C9F2_9GAST|nr:SET and MYND domain-containing protein 4-like [Plakobranchus ocellatus]